MAQDIHGSDELHSLPGIPAAVARGKAEILKGSMAAPR
jgi:hypothetical protein